MEKKEIEIMKKKLYNDNKTKSVQYYDEFEFLKAEKEYYAFKAEEIFVAEKKMKQDSKSNVAYELYNKKGELIAIADKSGNIEFTEKYKDKLAQMPKELYEKIGFDERRVQVKELEKNEKINKEKEATLEPKSEEKEIEQENEKEEKVPEQEDEKIEKMENDLGIDEKDIQSSSEIKDPIFYEHVPEAKEYKGHVSIVYIGSKNEFQVVGINPKNNKYEALQTLTASQAVEQNSSIDVGRNGEKVERKSLKAVIQIKGENEYSFSAKLEEMGPIELKELRRDFNTGEYMSSDIETSHQYPVTKEIEELRSKAKNDNIIEPVEQFKKQEEKENGDIVTNIESIEAKKEEKKKIERDEEKEEEEYQKTIYEKPPRYPYRSR